MRFYEASAEGVGDEGAERWRALWERSPQRSPFSTLAYAEAVRRGMGLAYAVVLAEPGAGAVPGAGALVFWRRQGPYRRVVVPPLTAFTSPLLSGPLDENAVHRHASPLDELIRTLEPAYAEVQLHLHPSLVDVRPFRWRGWRATPFYTYRLVLAPESEGLAGWSEGARRLFRRARTDFVVREDAASARKAVDLCAESYARHGRRLPAAPQQIVTTIEHLSAHGQMRLFTATAEGQSAPDGALAVLHDGQTACYWLAGSRPGPAMTVLLGDVLPRLHADGISSFDFIGANTPSIAEFKRRFGAVLTPYYRVEKINRTGLRLLRRFF